MEKIRAEKEESIDAVSEEERLKAVNTLNLPRNWSLDEIGKGYYRFELAQKGRERNWRLQEWIRQNSAIPRNAEWESYESKIRTYTAEKLGLSPTVSWGEIRAKEEANWLKDNWEDESKRKAKYEQHKTVGENIRNAIEKGAKAALKTHNEPRTDDELPEEKKTGGEKTADKLSENAEKLEKILSNVKLHLAVHGGTEKIYDAQSIARTEKIIDWSEGGPKETGAQKYLFDKKISDDDFENLKDKKVTVFELKPDLDGRIALYLMDLAGINYSHLTFMRKGGRTSGAMHFDTGEKPAGITIEGEESFVDHHQADKGEPTSASNIIYRGLLELKKINKEPWLENLIKFVNSIDNLSYDLPKSKDELRDSCGTLYGIYRGLSVESIIEFFKIGKDPFEKFTPSEMEKSVKDASGAARTIRQICNNNLNITEGSFKGIDVALKEMEHEKVKSETPELGKVIVNYIQNAPGFEKIGQEKQYTGEHRPKNYIQRGFLAIKAAGYDTYIAWYEDSNSFFITSSKDLRKPFASIKASFPEAKLIRGSMIISNIKIEKPDNFTIDKLLKALNLRK